MKPNLNGILGPHLLDYFRYFGPLLAVLLNQIQNLQVLLVFPIALHDFGIQKVIPPIPTAFTASMNFLVLRAHLVQRLTNR